MTFLLVVIFYSCLVVLCQGIKRVTLQDNLVYRKMTSSQLYNRDFGLDNLDVVLAAFGDINSDKYVDVFVLSANQTAIEVFLWDHSDQQYHRDDAWRIDVASRIVDVVPRDVNLDGHLDLIVTTQSSQRKESDNYNKNKNKHSGRSDNDKVNDKAQFSGELQVSTFLGKQRGWEAATRLGTHSLSHVVVIDANGDGLLDLLTQPPNNSNKNDNRENKNDSESDGASGVWGFWMRLHPQQTELQWVGVGEEGYYLHPYHTPIYADFNGDCVVDLFVVTVKDEQLYGEVWLYGMSNSDTAHHFSFSFRSPLPEYANYEVAADFDFDGDMDIMIAVCDPTLSPATCSLRIFSNIQMPTCSRWGGHGCRPQSNLCTRDNSYHFVAFDTQDFKTQHGVSEVDLMGVGISSLHAVSPIHLGDFNLDGYVDLSILYRDVKGVDRVALLRNEEGEGGKRTFVLQVTGVQELNDLEGVFSATFLDVDEKGSVDVVVQTRSPVDHSSHVHILRNNFYNDAFFLKMTSLNGVCAGWCDTGPKFPKPKPYGVNYNGATFKYTVTDLNTHKRVATAAPLSMNGPLSLQTPYSVMGLSRTCNYIEEFVVAIPHNNGAKQREWIGIVPNSQLIVIPYPRGQPDKWDLEMLIDPADYLVWICVSFGAAIVVLAMTSTVLQYRIKKEDLEEKLKMQRTLPM
eukprot:c9540_g1_i1.p1 GENE.c9540_g1_i1~~c9540_g1_i1.p1  ORF type:complete len:684 (+),score=156.54 c9540_g1_i1:67-2118(+)